MTPQELYQRFAAWLPPAMREAGYDTGPQHGGARTRFARDVGISGAMMTRWLKGTAMPGPDKYDTVARALGRDTVEMLLEIGIISQQQANERRKSAVRSSPMTPTEAADGLGIRDPVERQMFFGVLDRLTRTPETPPHQGANGGAAAEG